MPSRPAIEMEMDGDFATRHGIPVMETQAGKSALAQAHPKNFGATGSAAANAACESAGLVIGVGTRFQGLATGSWTLFREPGRKLVSINVQPHDAGKHGAVDLVSDAKAALEKLSAALGNYKALAFDPNARAEWRSRAMPMRAIRWA